MGGKSTTAMTLEHTMLHPSNPPLKILSDYLPNLMFEMEVLI